MIEQIALNIHVPGGTPSVAPGSPNSPSTGGMATGNQILFLENYTDKILPNPAYITGSMLWIDGVNPVPVGTYGNIGIGVDPGMRWTKAAGFPDLQQHAIFDIATIGNHAILPTSDHPQFTRTSISPPIAYRTGDCVMCSPQCESATNTLPRFETYFIIFVQNEGPFASAVKIFDPLEADIVFINGVQPIHLRSVIPGPAPAATKIRVLLRSHTSQTEVSNINHLVVGLQSEQGSPDMQNAPVIMTFNGQPSPPPLNRGDWVWSDWISLSIPAGQNIIFGSSLWNVSNAWNRVIPSTGLNSWYSTASDSWNSAVMHNVSGTHVDVTHVIMQVQVQ